jgi:hypothetical protein
MELLAGSLDVQVDDFLHAGYLSAAPRTFANMVRYEFELSDMMSNAKVIDVKASLQLKETAAETTTVPKTKAALTPAEVMTPASMSSDALVFAGLFFFFTFLFTLYYRRVVKLERPRWRPWLAAAVIATGGIMVIAWASPKVQHVRLNSLPPPWTDVPVQDYRDPQAATEAILHALIAPALPGVSVEIENLAAIQYEVAFPVAQTEYTPGMAYAQKTYGRDGWGNEFQLVADGQGVYLISSAGADGLHRTEDDIELITRAREHYDWEQLIHGMYVRPWPESPQKYACLIHRVSHRNFRREHPDMARKITGSDLFDTFTFDHESENFDPISGDALEQLDQLIGQGDQAGRSGSDAEDEPLIFLRFAAAAHG